MKNFLFLMLLISVGCAHLTKQGKKVKYTENVDKAKDCVFIQEVFAEPPFNLPNDWKFKIRNAAAKVDADLVVVKMIPMAGPVKGKAYKCQNLVPLENLETLEAPVASEAAASPVPSETPPAPEKIETIQPLETKDEAAE